MTNDRDFPRRQTLVPLELIQKGATALKCAVHDFYLPSDLELYVVSRAVSGSVFK